MSQKDAEKYWQQQFAKEQLHILWLYAFDTIDKQ